jgi:hypothetical protein
VRRKEWNVNKAGGRRGVAALVFVWGFLPPLLPAQVPVLELDHLYIVVQPPASLAAGALRLAGVTVDTTIERHTGQGTASIAAFFENAYLELLWVDSATSADSVHHDDLIDFARAANWRTTGASPFGLGLHFVTDPPVELPFPVRRDPAPHLGPNIFYLLLRQPQESLAVDVFIMPASGAVTAWLGRYRKRRPDLFTHPLGARRISRILLYGAPANRPRAADLVSGPVGFASAGTQYVVVEFDDSPQGRVWDLRPTLPLVLRR